MYDVIIVGAGHAGCEAALACARLKMNTLLLTINLDKIALMPCNPAIGGVGKSQLVRELDAMGGIMGKISDKTGIQFKILNQKKGPAVQALRAQIDKKEYEIEMKWLVEKTPSLILKQATVSKLLIENYKITGVLTEDGMVFTAKAVVITAGTFLRGRIIIGKKDYLAGRMGEHPAMNLTKSLVELGFEMDRFQTATPPRVDKRSIDFLKTLPSSGDDNSGYFSFWGPPEGQSKRNIPSFLTYTNTKTHELIAKNIKHSPIKSGIINTHGPRHCPSIDRKVVNFPQKQKHPVFIEPEGAFTNEMYLQGLTTSMPFDLQEKIVNTVKGLEHAKIIRPGYAVEYDYLIPSQLNYTMESKLIENLYFAGQINGTSGYEEAAVQGFVAGVNAALKISDREPLVLTRDNSYIGVLIDDLITKDLSEPYRMYTSRAEYRLLLRSDNADLRLSRFGYKLGFLKKQDYQKVLEKKDKTEELLKKLKGTTIRPEKNALSGLDLELNEPSRMYDLLKRPDISINRARAIMEHSDNGFDDQIWKQAEIIIKYEGYINRQLDEIRRTKNLDKYKLSPDIDYCKINGLTYEAREKLSRKRPNTLGQASRIAGVSPADISVLMLKLRRK